MRLALVATGQGLLEGLASGMAWSGRILPAIYADIRETSTVVQDKLEING